MMVAENKDLDTKQNKEISAYSVYLMSGLAICCSVLLYFLISGEASMKTLSSLSLSGIPSIIVGFAGVILVYKLFYISLLEKILNARRSQYFVDALFLRRPRAAIFIPFWFRLRRGRGLTTEQKIIKEIKDIKPTFNIGKEDLKKITDELSNNYADIIEEMKEIPSEWEKILEGNKRHNNITTMSQSRDALVVVDIQNDFIKGSLSVHDAKTLINPLNKAINYAHKEEMILIFTRDWHPSNHWSFKENNGPWSKHCVQNTPGAEFHKDLIIPPDSLIVDIGAEPKINGYSPYENPLMNALINRSDIKNVYVVGIALVPRFVNNSDYI